MAGGTFTQSSGILVDQPPRVSGANPQLFGDAGRGVGRVDLPDRLARPGPRRMWCAKRCVLLYLSPNRFGVLYLSLNRCIVLCLSLLQYYYNIAGLSLWYSAFVRPDECGPARSHLTE